MVNDRSGYTIVSSQAHAGKTVVAGGLAWRFRHDKAARRGDHARQPVGVFLPVAFNCGRRVREGLVSADAEFLAHCADCRADMPTICPVRVSELTLPGDYSTIRRAGLDLELVTECWQRLRREHELMIVQSPAQIYHPLGEDLQVIDLLVQFGLPTIVVSPAKSEAISTLLMTIECLRGHGLQVAAVVLNRYDPLQATAAEEISPEAVAKLADVPLPVAIPPDQQVDIATGKLGEDVIFAIEQIRL